MLPAAFVDEAVIEVCGGNGGRGIVSFLRTRSNPRGGPDGGSGGSGGDVIAESSVGVATLADLMHKRRWQASSGSSGGPAKRKGAVGKKLVLVLPLGTDIHDDETGDLHATLAAEGDSTVLARGGHGGSGNVVFKSSVDRAPRRASPGEPGEQRRFRMQLRLLADVGLVGLPNAGKSSLLSKLSAARPAVADYPFTTMRPHLGVVECNDKYLSRIVFADLPGIIAGAAEGVGVGLRFLRHVSRARILLHVVDCSSGSTQEVLDAINIVEHELVSAQAGKRQQRMLALSKTDLIDDACAQNLVEQVSQATGLAACAISSQAGTGLQELVAALAAMMPIAAEADA